ncbi:hypothetical protein Trydic_g7247 [Trypoxylus dichotomus]
MRIASNKKSVQHEGILSSIYKQMHPKSTYQATKRPTVIHNNNVSTLESSSSILHKDQIKTRSFQYGYTVEKTKSRTRKMANVDEEGDIWMDEGLFGGGETVVLVLLTKRCWRGRKEEGKITETYMTGLRVMKMIAAASQV